MKKYLPGRGLAFKTFVFALLLMTVVMIMTLGILYVFLPRHYFNHITNQLDRNANILIETISQNPESEDALLWIIDFSTVNNATVMSFDERGQPLTEFTSHPSLQHYIRLASAWPSQANDFEEIFISTTPTEPRFRIEEFDLVFMPSPSYPIDVVDIVPRTLHGIVTYPFSDVTRWIHMPSDNVQTSYVTLAIYAEGDFMVSEANDHRSVAFVRNISHPLIDHIAFTSTLQPIDQAQDVILAMAPYLMTIGFVIALAMAFVFSRHLTKPIIKIADAAAQMRQMEPGVVSGINSGDEVGRLSRNLDKLYEDLCANIQDLQAEMTRTAELERSKTDLMRAAGHELKTPIAALSGMLDGMIDRVGAYKDRDKYLPELKSQTERLSKLVHEILLASQTEETDNNMEIASVDIDALINETARQYLPLVEKKSLNLNIVPNGGFCYNTDRRLLFIALSNLVSNAVKYTPERGSVRIGMATYQRGKVLYIENQCGSIDPNLISKWFEPFYTPDYSRDKSKGGTGLGLYIVKKYLNALELPFEIATVDDGIRFEIAFP